MNRFSLLLAILLSVILFGLDTWLVRLPDVRPESIPENQFSSERAINLLKHLLDDNTPHPVGSSANKAVRMRISQWLSEQHIEWEVQSTWACAFETSRCAWVENIIATLPGKNTDMEQNPYVALMAHYDSVPMAPGAGDDGAGVVTTLEVARILKMEGPANNPLMLIITDSEEVGLMGAEAFFNQHPLAKSVGMVVNVEGGGSSGHSQVLRTAFGSRMILSSYVESAKYPFGNSIANEMFKRMPNDTDFSVSMRASIPGIDFAFASELSHYHTPNDNTDNLDPRSVQHHGENVLPLTRVLLAAELGNLPADELAYSQSYAFWLQWQDTTSLWILVFALALLFIASVRFKVYQYPARELSWSLLGTPALVTAVIAVAFMLFKAIALLNGTTVSWPATDWPFRMVLFTSPVLCVAWTALFLNNRVPQTLTVFATWWWWAVFAALLTFTVPGAAGPLLIPLLASSVLLLGASFLKNSNSRTTNLTEYETPDALSWTGLASLVFVIPNTLSLVLPLETTQGYGLIIATFPLLALFAMALAPLARGTGLRITAISSSILMAVAITFAASMPLYSPWRPQHVNIHYSENLADQTARVQLSSRNPAPQLMLATQNFSSGTLSLYPWDETGTDDIAEVSPSGWDGPTLSVNSVESRGKHRLIDLNLQAQRPVYGMFLLFDQSVNVVEYAIDGNKVKAHKLTRGPGKGAHRLFLFGINQRPVNLKILVEDKGPADLYLADISTTLPASIANTYKARHPLASPVHQGDLATLYRKIQL